MPGSKLLFDTSALVEMLQGSAKGEAAKALFLTEGAQPQVASVSIAELASKLARLSHDAEGPIRKISEAAEILPMSLEVASAAGGIHAKLKAKDRNISLADCIIMAHADAEGATVVTTDRHFLLYKNSKIL